MKRSELRSRVLPAAAGEELRNKEGEDKSSIGRNRTVTAMTLSACLLLLTLYSHQAQAAIAFDPGYDCSDIWHKNNASTSGIYTIQPKGTDVRFSFKVFCEMSKNGGWTLIQRHDGSDALDFDKKWDEYRYGFGKRQGEHWLGLEYMYSLTHQTGRPAKLRISIGSFDGKGAYAEYNPFSVGDVDSSYKLSVGTYSGTAGNAFLGYPAVQGSNQYGRSFSTRDHPTADCGGRCKIGGVMYHSCGDIVRSGWWFNGCESANLNGRYHTPPAYKGFASSVSWPTWRDRESLKFSRMYLIHQ